jgi:hypothetical protein
MNIFKRDTALEVVAVNPDTGSELKLIYSLYDIDIVDRWIALVNENNLRENELRYNYRKILNDQEIEARFQKFRENIQYINDHYDRVLTDIVTIEFLRANQNILNDLHEEFEIYGDRLDALINSGYFNKPSEHADYNPVWPGDTHNKVTHECFLLLNEQIHNFETIFRTWEDRNRSLCTCLVDFIPAGLHAPLKAEDYFLFTPDHEWGCAYLGYNTLGKHWSSTMHDNDIDVVRRDAVRPQQRFAAEMYMNFSTPYMAQTRIEFYKWWTENNISELHDPAMKLGDWAMGYIPVARLSKYQIDSESMMSVPLSWGRPEKLLFNREVWSRFSTIKSVKIVR